MLDRTGNLQLVDEFVTSDSLKRHMLAVEAAMRAYAESFGQDVELWMVRPQRLEGLTAASVKKKLKNLSFAATVHREDITRGAEAFGVELDEHIEFCARAMHRAKIV